VSDRSIPSQSANSPQRAAGGHRHAVGDAVGVRLFRIAVKAEKIYQALKQK